MKKSISMIILTFIFCSCSHLTQKQKRVEELKELQRKSIVHKKEFWISLKELPLEQRFGPASEELINYLKRDNEIWEFDERPKFFKVGAREIEIFKDVIRNYPDSLRKRLEKNLLGIFVVENLGSSALTDGIRAFPKKSFMVFDRRVFEKKANDWCSWKERSPFKESHLKCTIEKARTNGFKEAFQYIFTHEVAHVVNREDSSLLPFWDEKMEKIQVADFPYLKLSWKKEGNQYLRKENDHIYKDVIYYAPKERRVEGRRAYSMYSLLQDSAFPSLYGVTNPWDDFAEAFVIYYHTQKLKRPFLIEVREGKKKITYRSCLQTGSCPEKYKLIQTYFQ